RHRGSGRVRCAAALPTARAGCARAAAAPTGRNLCAASALRWRPRIDSDVDVAVTMTVAIQVDGHREMSLGDEDDVPVRGEFNAAEDAGRVPRGLSSSGVGPALDA